MFDTVDYLLNWSANSLFHDDFILQIWLLSVEKDGVASLECAADLTRHTKPVNCVRFSPSGELLASGDDGQFYKLFYIAIAQIDLLTDCTEDVKTHLCEFVIFSSIVKRK